MSTVAELAQQCLESAERFEQLNLPEARIMAQTCRFTAKLLTEGGEDGSGSMELRFLVRGGSGHSRSCLLDKIPKSYRAEIKEEAPEYRGMVRLRKDLI